MSELKAPFPWFGGKRKIAAQVWNMFDNPDQYVEPFAGSLAVLLARPTWGRDHVETVNDLDGMLVNTWRAIRADAPAVAQLLDVPVMEIELHARLAYVADHRDSDFTQWMEGDPDHYDAKLAAYWLYATCNSIGYPFDPGPWHVVDGRLVNLGDKGRGVNREMPHLGSKGQGILTYLNQLAQRLQYVRILCGDWQRTLTKSAIGPYPWNRTAIFLDPPYQNSSTLYHTKDETTISARVEEWCANAPTDARIIITGYDNEHDALINHGWTRRRGKAGSSGYDRGNNSHRETIWASPACLTQHDLFTTLKEETE